jgi:protein-tyrosine phosphatase
MSSQTGQAKCSVLFICMGNICRSPLAEGIFRVMVQKAGLESAFHIDSAGTHFYHVGAPPDERSVAVGLKYGYDLTAQRCRLVQAQDFTVFDYILAMDKRNLRDLSAVAPTAEMRQKPKLLLDFARVALLETEVPDPYYGGEDGFENVLKLVEHGCEGLLAQIKETILSQSNV